MSLIHAVANRVRGAYDAARTAEGQPTSAATGAPVRSKLAKTDEECRGPRHSTARQEPHPIRRNNAREHDRVGRAPRQVVGLTGRSCCQARSPERVGDARATAYVGRVK